MVLVFGSINLDLVAQVGHLPRPGETVAGNAFVTAPGGKGANQALAARQAGARVTLYGAVGDDAFAGAALANLGAAGVDLSGVARIAGPTGVALINVDAQGENAITVVPGANGHARAAQVPAAALRADATLLLQLELPVTEVAALARRARSAGARVVLNGAPAAPLPDGTLDCVDVFAVNEGEAAFYAQALGWPALPPESFCARMQARFGLATVLTLGPRGALAFADGVLLEATPPAVTVVDTTGAGDALVGTLAAALDRGAGLAAALREGVAAGALACARRGAQRA